MTLETSTDRWIVFHSMFLLKHYTFFSNTDCSYVWFGRYTISVVCLSSFHINNSFFLNEKSIFNIRLFGICISWSILSDYGFLFHYYLSNRILPSHVIERGYISYREISYRFRNNCIMFCILNYLIYCRTPYCLSLFHNNWKVCYLVVRIPIRVPLKKWREILAFFTWRNIYGKSQEVSLQTWNSPYVSIESNSINFLITHTDTHFNSQDFRWRRFLRKKLGPISQRDYPSKKECSLSKIALTRLFSFRKSGLS